MTIITKPISEKKVDKSAISPENEKDLLPVKDEDVEAQSPTSTGFRMVIVPRMRRISTTTTLCLLLTALMVVGVGIVGGTYLYQQYIRSQLRFKGWCSIPFNDNGKAAMFINPDLGDSDMDLDSQQTKLYEFLREQFELDLERDTYEKIEVPSFRNGRDGRFIHDFSTNMTSIVDIFGKRCFLMPLNRVEILPPRSFYDLLNKIRDGHYSVNTEVVRETMHVLTPALTQDDLKNVGTYIAQECEHYPVYKLEKYVGGVVKRSVDNGSTSGMFVQFAGSHITEINILNLDNAVPLKPING